MTLPELQQAYHELLGIPPEDQPPDYYRLLGLRRVETNPVVIKNAADCRMAFVRKAASGPYSEASQQLLNDLAEAKLCLLNERRRATYDEMLRAADAAKAAEAKQGEQSPSLPTAGHQRPDQATKAERGPAPGKRTIADRGWIIGSADDCDIVITNPYVSKRHCRLIALEGRFILEDTNSRNGTFVNGRKISKPTEVDPQDIITLGRQTLLPWPVPQAAPN